MERTFLFKLILAMMLCRYLATTNAKIMSEENFHSDDKEYKSGSELGRQDFYLPLRGVASQMHYLMHLAPEPLEEQDEDTKKPLPTHAIGYDITSLESLEKQYEETENPLPMLSVHIDGTSPQHLEKWNNETENTLSTPIIGDGITMQELLKEQDEETETKNRLSTPSVGNDVKTLPHLVILEKQYNKTENPSYMSSIGNLEKSSEEDHEETKMPSSITSIDNDATTLEPSDDISDYEAAEPEIIVSQKQHPTECRMNGGVCRSSCEKSLQHNSKGCRRNTVCCLIAITVW